MTAARYTRLASLALLALPACGTQFDTIDQLDGLRVLGVQKDHPYARPGDEVNLRILYHDTGIRKAGEAEGKRRNVMVAWLSGCTNPDADLYALCLDEFRRGPDSPEAPGAAEVPGAAEASDGGVPEGDAGGDGGAADGEGSGSSDAPIPPPFQPSFGDEFRFRVPDDVISSRPPPSDPTQPRYGLNYVFFAACAGQLRPDPESDFPLGCFDSKGTPLGARDFVAGYTAVYSYEDFTNKNPMINGLEINDKKVPAERVCIGADCETLAPDPERKCGPDDPVVERCEDPDAVGSCDTLRLRIDVDPKSVEVDDTLTARNDGNDVDEQMWANFHTDRGKFTNNVALVNDLNTGFNREAITEFVAPDVAGPAQIWAVVRDNRAGVQWLRTQVCVKD